MNENYFHLDQESKQRNSKQIINLIDYLPWFSMNNHVKYSMEYH